MIVSIDLKRPFVEIPRNLDVSAAIAKALATLRMLEQSDGPLVVDVEQLRDVERAVDCHFPDDVLAVIASGLDTISDNGGFALASIAEIASEAWRLGCPAHLVAIFRQPLTNTKPSIETAAPALASPPAP